MDGAQSHTHARSKIDPRGLTVAALDKRLQLRRRAREDGARNLPRGDAADLSEAEQAALALVAGAHAEVDAARAGAQRELERRLQALAPTPQDFAGPALDAQLTLKQVEGRLAHDWRDAAQRARQARAHLDAFKHEHGLRRAAVYPAATLLQAGLLLLAALAEAMFSAALFAEEDARGLLGGAITAIGLSGANVALGFLAGFLGLRYLQHRRMVLKAAGALGFGALALLALMLNLFAADWRDRLAAESGQLTRLGSDASFEIWSLLQVQSPQAVILLMLGAGVWVFAALKGYSGFDDPYPDFGKMDRAARDASEDLSEFRAEARLELEAPFDAARAALSARLEKMRAEFEAMNKAFDQGAAAIEALNARSRALDDVAGAAVQLYRQENLAARSAPAPAYFGAAPPALGAPRDALAGAAAMIDEARARLTEAHQLYAEALQSAGAALEEAAARLDSAAA